MAATLEQFFDALREELQQYGEMLALLEARQDALHQCGAETTAARISLLNAHCAIIEAARRSREDAQRRVAWALGVPDGNTIWDLVPVVPVEYRPLLEALIQEIQELLKRVCACAHEKHEHLRHSLELMEQFIAKLAAPVASALLGEKPPSIPQGEIPSNLSAAV